MSPAVRANLQIHLCVVLWGFTAILGKLISLPAFELVWWRMWLVAGALLLLPRVWRALAVLPRRMVLVYCGIGLLVALHWLTFYGAIKLANASVAAVCMAFAPVFVALVEPALVGRRFELRELLIGIAAIPGVALVIGGTPAEMQIGIVVGAISALLAALFGTLNKRYVMQADPLVVTGLELAAGAVFLTVAAPLLPGPGSLPGLPGARDGLLLVVLAYLCTLLPFALSLVALRHLSAFTAQLAVSLEPVYAIVLAILLLGEQRELSVAFYVGVVIVLGAVFVHPLIARRRAYA
ncbi:MAG TPA: DMT family transporter [Steroidobacteraceae bacterium]|nr:DMT family transporter [Steroidobacteraceae bacterium]